MMADGNKIADQSIQEHQNLKDLLYEIDSMAPEHPEFVPKVKKSFLLFSHF